LERRKRRSTYTEAPPFEALFLLGAPGCGADMVEEVKEYYSRFYDYELTDDEAQRILLHMPSE
jgi:hypothetical protein